MPAACTSRRVVLAEFGKVHSVATQGFILQKKLTDFMR